MLIHLRNSHRSHPQMVLVHPLEGNYHAAIDVVIAPLIMACWQLRINTAQSCQDYDERQDAWIRFATAKDAVRFFEVVLPVMRDMRWFSSTNPIVVPEVYFPFSEIPRIIGRLQEEVTRR